jgi:hypothetical protein
LIDIMMHGQRNIKIDDDDDDDDNNNLAVP